MKKGGENWRDPHYAQANSERNQFPLFCPWAEEKAWGEGTKRRDQWDNPLCWRVEGDGLVTERV